MRTDAEGRFTIASDQDAGPDRSLYLVARGGIAAAKRAAGANPAIGLIAALGATPPPRVTINAFTTIATAWTHNQVSDGGGLRGAPLPLRIAAGNVPSFVDLASGGYGAIIADATNSAQTPTMAQFATLANALAGCAAQVAPGACASLYAAAQGPPATRPRKRWARRRRSCAIRATSRNASSRCLDAFLSGAAAATPANTPACPTSPSRRAPGCCR